jgi:hypothetical protein
VATKQFSVPLFEEALVHCCWIAASLTLFAGGGEAIQITPVRAGEGLSSLRVATKQSSVLLFEKALAHCCWIASSLRSSQ